MATTKEHPADRAPAARAGDPTLVLLTVEEAARRLQIGRTYCFRLIRTGQLESVPVGRLRRVPSEAVIAFAAQLRRAHQPAA
ncbi:excisionase family DNA-binding protein [Streptomyces sp. NPDC005180]|uniref:excisionase family DNA-binding protein n=1 Tax=Streptomyces sp. NPDC005180 TaxID=3156868 RepID=UPI0033B4B1B0